MSRPRIKRRSRRMDRKLTLSRPDEEIISREEVSPLSTLELERWLLDGALAVEHDDGADHARGTLTHNHCGWPGIRPTSPGGVGDILYWTTPGAFRYGPLQRTPSPQP
jgi:hypothetical protein